jgi:hypothetical protein
MREFYRARNKRVARQSMRFFGAPDSLPNSDLSLILQFYSTNYSGCTGICIADRGRKRAPCIHDVPYARMIRLTDEDGPRVNDPIQETRALRFPSFSPSSLPFSLIVVPSPASDCASHESPPTPRRISLLSSILRTISRHSVDKDRRVDR